MNLQQQVQQHLDSTGISLRELSRRSGVSHTTIGKILRGGEYKSGTAEKLAAEVNFLHPRNFREEYRELCAMTISQEKISEELSGSAEKRQPNNDWGSVVRFNIGETLHDKVEQLAAERVDCDIQTRDDALGCGKQRRIEALEAEVVVWQDKACQALANARKQQDYADARSRESNHHSEKAAELRGAVEQISADLSDANAEIKRLTALSETHGQNWKAACVQVEQLQKQLDHAKETIDDLKHEVGYQLREAEKANTAFCEQSLSMMDRNVTIEALKSQSKQTKTKHDQQIMRLRVYVWILIAALVFVVASGFMVLRGGV